MLPESAVINEYLEERHPEPPLLPSDRAARAAARLLIFRYDDFTRPYYALRRGEPRGRGGVRRGARRARRDARRDAVPHRGGVRPRRHRLRPVGDPRPRDCSACRSSPTRTSRPGWICCPSAPRSRPRSSSSRACSDAHGRRDREELERRLGEEGLVLLDVRSAAEYRGEAGYPCDARQGHHPRRAARRRAGARSLPASPAEIRALVGAPEGAEVVAYCHSGSRSAIAVAGARLARATTRATTSAPGTSGRRATTLPASRTPVGRCVPR